MTQLDEAVADVSAKLSELRVPHMLIGGLAVSAWGEPRATLDVDLCLWVSAGEVKTVVDRLIAEYEALPNDPLEFARRTSVLPMRTPSGIRVDCVFARLPYEERAISRSRTKPFGGFPVPVIPVEDLILVKLASERDKDLEDARKLLRRHANTLDREYLEPLLLELAEGLARDDIPTLLKQTWA